MRTAVSYIQTNLLDYETGEFDRRICIRTAEGNLKYSYLLKWLDAKNDGIITEIPDQLILDVVAAYNGLVLGEWPISELAMMTLTWDEVDAIYKSDFQTKGSRYDSRTLTDLSHVEGLLVETDDLSERMMIVREYIEAYLVLKGRINKMKCLELVREYTGQKSMIEVLRRESEKLNAIILTKNNL